jgi:hypothetical protein
MPDDTTRQQKLIDALQVIEPLAQRLEVTARQQQVDAAALLEAARRAIVEVRPGNDREKEEGV